LSTAAPQLYGLDRSDGGRAVAVAKMCAESKSLIGQKLRRPIVQAPLCSPSASPSASPVGHARGCIGCLMGGCCYGRPIASGFPLAVELAGATRR
jgi:hypothetical protein